MNPESVIKNEQSNLLDGSLHIPDPHEIVLAYFRTNNRNAITSGLFHTFKKRLWLMISIILIAKLFFSSFSLFFNIIFLVISIPLLICVSELILQLINLINLASQKSLSRFFLVFFIATFIIIIFGNIIL